MFMQHTRTHAHTHTHTHTFTRWVTRHCRRKGYAWTSEKRGARRAATCPTSTTPSCCCTGSPSGWRRVLLPQAPPGGVLGLARRRASAGAVSTRLCVYCMCVCVCVLYVHTCTVRGVARGECWRGVYDREAERPGGLSACMRVYATCIDAHACRMHMQVFTTARPRRRKGSRSFRTCCAAGSAQPWQTTAVRAARPVRGAMMSLTWGRGPRRGLRERRRCRCRSAPELWCRMEMVREQRHRCQPCLRGALLAASDLG